MTPGNWRETKSAPPLATKPRRGTVMASMCSALHGLGGPSHCIDDCGVGTATAQMRGGRCVGVGVLDLGHGGIGDAAQQLYGHDHHPALAITALRHLLVDPGLLNRVQRTGVSRLRASFGCPERG